MRLKFWIKNALTYSGLMLLAAPIYMALIALQNEDITTAELYAMGTGYYWMFAGMMVLILGINLYVQFLNLSLGFGSTRKEAFWGVFCYRLICPTVITAGYLLLYALMGEGNAASLTSVLPFGLGLFLFSGACGSVCGMLWNKLNKKAFWIMIPIYFLATVGFIGLMVVIQLEGRIGELLIAGTPIPWIFLGLGIAAHFLCMIPEYKTIYKYNVKL